MRSLNFFSKQLLSFILIGVIPVVIIGSISYIYCTNLLQESMSDHTLNNVIKISERIDLFTSELGEIIVYLLCEDAQIRKALQQSPDANLNSINKRITELASRRNVNIYITDTTGMITFSTAPVPDTYDIRINQGKGIFAAADAFKNRFIIYPNNQLNNFDNKIAFCLARAIRDLHDHPIGYVILEVSKEKLIGITHMVNTIYNMNFILLDADYCTLYNLFKPEIEKSILDAALKERIMGQNSGVFLESIDNKWMTVAFCHSEYTNLTAIGTVPIDSIVKNANIIKKVTLWACLVCLLFCSLLAFYMARSVSQPIYEIVNCMRQVEAGNLETRVEFTSSDEIGLMGQSFNKMVTQLKSLIHSITEKQERLKQAEIKALQAQINPHFLYNTLDTIKWLAKLKWYEELKVIVTELGKLLRNSISSNKEFITVRECMEFINNYLKIQKIRYGDRLRITFNINPVILDYHIPKLLLQPIVENAIIHGLENKIGVGNLEINGRQEDGELVFEVIDDGLGMEPGKVALLNAKINWSSTSDCIGLQNVNRRIQLYYGPDYGLHLESQPGKGTKATLRFPLLCKEEVMPHL
ncbi:MAG: sensor histidine kinase [Firmicutes bacterium]|nr:sensor histidine kinase [Bacillota bacterium]